MNLKHAAKVVGLAYLPVIAAILIMILVRANDLAREALNGGLEPGFFVPSTPAKAITSGFVIWIPGALMIGVLAYALYAGMRRAFRVGPAMYGITTLVLGVLMSAGLWATGNAFAPEGTFEMLACGLGYGILIPYFSAKFE